MQEAMLTTQIIGRGPEIKTYSPCPPTCRGFSRKGEHQNYYRNGVEDERRPESEDVGAEPEVKSRKTLNLSVI